MTEYKHYSHVMSSDYDSAFRTLVTSGVGVEDTLGAVDEPTGHLALVIIQKEDLDEGNGDIFAVLNEAGEPLPSPGVYIVHENNLGIVVVFAYESEALADKDWDRAADELEVFYDLQTEGLI